MALPIENVNHVRLNHQEQRMNELKESVDRLNETIVDMTRTFIEAQVCERRVSAIEADHKTLMKLVESHQELVTMAKKFATSATGKTAKAVYLAVGGYIVATRPELNGVWTAVKVLFLP